MALIDKIKDFKQKLNEKLNFITNEETTKQVIIRPFLEILGYDFQNPTQIQSEYPIICVGRKDRIDYAILFNQSNNLLPIAYIECKSVTEKLNKHIPQINKYFGVNNVTTIVLTNGIDWWFFSDTLDKGIMDSTPFFTFNILDFQQCEYDLFKNFVALLEQPSTFKLDAKYLLEDKVKSKFKSITSECNQEFIKLFDITELNSKKLKQILEQIIKE